MTSKLLSVLSPLQTVGRGRLAAIALGSAASGYVGVVTYRWQRKWREKKDRWSPLTTFSSGVALGVISMAISPALRRWKSPRSDRVLSSVLPMLRANSEVRQMVGASLTPGLFRAYSYSGGVKWSGVRRSNGINWSPFTLQPCEWNGAWNPYQK
ncbi:hypothetical protein GBAR_LOCUS20677 [Geodia barretti]|uniref:Uncharacterized protein n=1 Tax=Geodia barretti TaxID=519541 RepID=A0AA35WWY7_GEOBA|nr:hypothetical protein GBAR_LOCUS20677 [Geodia barretti]